MSKKAKYLQRLWTETYEHKANRYLKGLVVMAYGFFPTLFGSILAAHFGFAIISLLLLAVLFCCVALLAIFGAWAAVALHDFASDER